MHYPKKLFKIRAAKYAKLKYLASTSTYPYSYYRSRQREKKQTAKILFGKRKEKQQIKPNLLEAARKTPCENFIIITTLFLDQASKQVIFSAKYNAKHYYGSGVLPEDLFFVLEPSMIAVENKSS